MIREELTKNIGLNIRKSRLQKDVSQEALAFSAGIHPAYIGRLERGEKCPTIDTLYKICEALGVSVCEILNFKNESFAPNCEAKFRIKKVLDTLPNEQQLKIAEIIENIADINKNKV